MRCLYSSTQQISGRHGRFEIRTIDGRRLISSMKREMLEARKYKESHFHRYSGGQQFWDTRLLCKCTVALTYLSLQILTNLTNLLYAK